MEYNLPIQAGSSIGDLLYVAILGPIATPPSGWTSRTGTVGGLSWSVFNKTLTSADLTSGTMFQFVLGTADLVATIALQISGSTGIDRIGVSSPVTSAASIGAPSVNPTGSTDLLICLYLVGRANAKIALLGGLTPVIVTDGLRDTQCILGHVHAARDFVANNNLCPVCNGPSSGTVVGAPSIAIGSKVLSSSGATGVQIATWTGLASAIAVTLAFGGTSPTILSAQATTQ